ncbi:XTP/dITP diphosphohydrolase [Arcticibacter tournemirensis]|uniref:dITP/XTP pyrophosphatase n=1 Tax=Arcticibacter tournemirensis TaxID=699437 RepID=A0A5M9HHG8_9SPHI|nr:non-canonical purine NTP diphosphatase [Arcticibacter tournemirensis]KAA8485903.1 non-canonical purine NTP diphosphatase [Arcticibacter tournemirensis]TQM46840.1 XTP/dITP diphosphohydrolase [Arcticibacter tournemirensis]
MRTLIFATNNKHKLEEVQALTGNRFKLKTLEEIGCFDDIPETGHTFRENASQKSHYLAANFKVDCFADDSGLEVDALNGDPGVYSARYSGTRDSEKNLQLVLEKMKGKEDRKARFRCVISLIINGKEYFFEGTVEGTIAHEKSGIDGFGYDPIFTPEGYSKTFAEMDPDEKNAISHRGQAVNALISFLNKI